MREREEWRIGDPLPPEMEKERLQACLERLLDARDLLDTEGLFEFTQNVRHTAACLANEVSRHLGVETRPEIHPPREPGLGELLVLKNQTEIIAKAKEQLRSAVAGLGTGGFSVAAGRLVERIREEATSAANMLNAYLQSQVEIGRAASS